MFTYFLILNDYGIRPTAVWKMATTKSILPGKGDIYDETDSPFFGNSNLKAAWSQVYPGWQPSDPIDQTADPYWLEKYVDPTDTNGDVVELTKLRTLAWDHQRNSKVDVRLFYSAPFATEESWTNCRFGTQDTIRASSHVSEAYPICYSTESLKYAQSGYLVSIVTVQAAGLISAKTRNLSLYQQGMINGMGNFGLFFEFALVALLLYIPPFNLALGTRPIAPEHFAVPTFSFYISIFFYDELRKIFIRRGMLTKDKEGKVIITGWIAQNTYY